MTSNKEMITKAAIQTANVLVSGGLNPEQQDRFNLLVRSYTDLLDQVRFVPMPQPRWDIDKLHVGEPLTVGASENTPHSTDDEFVPKFNKVELTAEKVRTDWLTTTEMFQKNIEQDNFEATLMEGITRRFATDLEMLAIQGDKSITATDPISKLRKANDGWAKLSDSAHIIDAGSGKLTKAAFKAAKQALPKQFRSDSGMRFYTSPNAVIDWLDQLATGPTGAGNPGASGIGDAALQGRGIAPYGVPLQEINLIPDDLSVTTGSDEEPVVYGTEAGPFDFDGQTDGLVTINVDGAGAVAITFGFVADSKTTLDAVEVAAAINAALVANDAAHGHVARVEGEGRLVLVGPTAGSGGSIVIAEGSPAGVLDVLGLSAGTTAGTDAADPGTQLDGTFMWYVNPMNLIYGVLDGTRIYSEFNQDYDRVETVIYNQLDFEIENLDAMVKVTNLRTDSLELL